MGGDGATTIIVSDGFAKLVEFASEGRIFMISTLLSQEDWWRHQ